MLIVLFEANEIMINVDVHSDFYRREKVAFRSFQTSELYKFEFISILLFNEK